MAEGFPVRRRSNADVERGLEIPLDIMVALSDANKVTMYHGQLMIKGPDALFVPIKRTNPSIAWHLFVASPDAKAKDRRISYNAWEGEGERNVDRASLFACRHFLGWTDTASQHAGEIHLIVVPYADTI